MFARPVVAVTSGRLSLATSSQRCRPVTIASQSRDKYSQDARQGDKSEARWQSACRAVATVCVGVLALAAQAQERAIEAQVLVKAPIEKVWQAWTTRAGIRTFFAPDAEVEARVVHACQTFSIGALTSTCA